MHQETNNSPTAVTLGQQWKDAPDSYRLQYRLRAEELRKIHKEQNPDYQYNPRKSADRKRRMTKAKAVYVRQLMASMPDLQPRSSKPLCTEESAGSSCTEKSRLPPEKIDLPPKEIDLPTREIETPLEEVELPPEEIEIDLPPGKIIVDEPINPAGELSFGSLFPNDDIHLAAQGARFHDVIFEDIFCPREEDCIDPFSVPLSMSPSTERSHATTGKSFTSNLTEQSSWTPIDWNFEQAMMKTFSGGLYDDHQDLDKILNVGSGQMDFSDLFQF